MGTDDIVRASLEFIGIFAVVVLVGSFIAFVLALLMLVFSLISDFVNDMKIKLINWAYKLKKRIKQ